MSELRAPDPTLDALGPPYVFLHPTNDEALEIAHYDPDQGTDSARCGWSPPGDLVTLLPAEMAAFIAVPCRECFPDAPPPGWRPSEVAPIGADGERLVADRFLEWQVTA